MRYVNIEVENLKALIDNEFTAIRRSIECLQRKYFITSNMSFIDSLKKEVPYLTKENIIKTEISLTESLLLKNIKLLRQQFCKMKIQIANLIYHQQIRKR